MNQQLKIPPSHNKLCREGALERLSRHGIEGKRVYLIDLIPLIEMIWAGGQVKAEKIDFLYNFIKRHINHINRLAGYVVLSMADAINFTGPYLNSRPNMALLKKLRECIIPVRIGVVRNDYGDIMARRIVAACLNILSITLAQYPHELQNTCCLEEREMYLDIMQTFGTYYFKEDKPISEWIIQ